MHPILAKIDDLDAAITGSVELAHAHQGENARRRLSGYRHDLSIILEPPAPGSTTIHDGATITHRPDFAYDERARHAAQQGDADRGGYPPSQRKPLAK